MGQGVGGALRELLQRLGRQHMLVGTWAAPEWAIRFYRRHCFELVAPGRTGALLKAYWTIPDRQIATSVVLAKPPFAEDQVRGPTAATATGKWAQCSAREVTGIRSARFRAHPRAASGAADAEPLGGALRARCGSPRVVYRRAMADPATAGRPG